MKTATGAPEKQPNPITTIKAVRSATGLGLAEAVAVVAEIWVEHGWELTPGMKYARSTVREETP